MKSLRVFECGVCLKTYNFEKRKPLSLPCGHVFCQECLSKCVFEALPEKVAGFERQDGFAQGAGQYIVCPSDNRHYNANIEELPVCYAILTNLPKESAAPASKTFTCVRHPKKTIKYFCETHSEFLCSLCVVQHTGLGHSVSNFTITPEEMRSKLNDTLFKFEEQVSESVKTKTTIEGTDRKMVEYYNCQLSKLNMAYDSAIKILNEKRKHFSDLLKQSLSEEKKRLYSDRSALFRRIEKFNDSIKSLKEMGTSLDHFHYEDIYKALVQANEDLKAFPQPPIKAPSEMMYAHFKDTIKLRDMGSIQYLSNIDVKEGRGVSHSKGPRSPMKDHHKDSKNHGHGSDLDSSKRHRKKPNHRDPECVFDKAERQVPESAAKPEEDSKAGVGEAYYPQTSRGKATPSKQKNIKVAANSSHVAGSTPTTALPPRPGKEISETMVKFGTSNLEGISNYSKQGNEKENVEAEIGEKILTEIIDCHKIQTTRDNPKLGTNCILPMRNECGTGRGSSTCLAHVVTDQGYDKPEMKIMEENSYIDNTHIHTDSREWVAPSGCVPKIECIKSSQRSTSTSHRQTHNPKCTSHSKGPKGVLQAKQLPQQVLRIAPLDKIPPENPPVQKKKQGKHKRTTSF